MLTVLGIGAWAGAVSPWIFFGMVAVAALAEFIEWVAVDRLGRKYGGSRRTFWGALAGGVVGAIVGTPVPVIGSLIGVLAGTLIGAALATWTLVRDSELALQAGWGALLGRSVAIAVKTTAGLFMLLAGGAALLF